LGARGWGAVLPFFSKLWVEDSWREGVLNRFLHRNDDDDDDDDDDEEEEECVCHRAIGIGLLGS
jgi:hypothetical protein